MFTPADFAQYAPRTALDMVTRIPGFSITDDDDGSRGFGDARGNVLINGQRISGKSNGVTSALGRIQAANVTRLEIADGASLGIAGLSGQVVNVITADTTARSGTWDWRTRIRENLSPAYNDINVSLSGGANALSWSVEADSSPERGANGGERLIRDGAGTLIETRRESFKYEADNYTLSGSLGWKPASGDIGNLNAKYQIARGGGKDAVRTYPVGGLEGRRFSSFYEDEWNTEIGGDYEITFGPGRLKSIGLVRLEHSPFEDVFRRGRLNGTGISEDRFTQTTDEGEYILRSEYALKTGEGRDWQASLEGAFNFLESEAALQVSSNGGAFVSVPLDLTNSRVEEIRGQFTLTHGRALSEKLTLKLSAGAEVSEISQTGDAQQVRRFTRPKGYADLTYRPNDKLGLVLRLEREVGQLDFYDFISSVDLDDDRSSLGNPDIVPQQAWVASLSAERDLGDWGAFTLKVSGESIEDLVDRLPIGSSDAIGNLESATRLGVDLTSTLKLTPLGFTGAELEISAEAYESEVDDPLTGQARRINNDLVSYVEIGLRQDVPSTDWAWGVNFESYRQGSYYRLSETGQESNVPGFVYGFLEHKDIYGLNASIVLGNLANQADKFERTVFQTNRLGPVVRTEEREAYFGPVFLFTLKGTF